MRAAIYHGPGSGIEVQHIAEPVPETGELLVEVGFCGICGSDMSLTSGSSFDYPTGQCFGHEYSGTVVEKGAGVTGWRIGDTVACMPKSGCGRCEPCREGRLLLCVNGKSLGSGFSEFVAVPTQAAVRLPQTLSLADGALIEPMACGLRALHSAGMKGGERVLVLGAGTMALSVIWWARRLGAASIVVASRSAQRRDICMTFGADALHSFDEDDPATLHTALGGPPNFVAECVGKEGMLNLALDHVRVGGTVICMGMCVKPEAVLPIRLTFKEAKLTFPLAYSAEEFEETARAFDQTGFNPAVMVNDVIPLERLGVVLESMRTGTPATKVHVDPRMHV